MLFHRKSKREKVAAAAGRAVPSGRAVVATVGVAGGIAAVLTAASSGISALRQKLA